MLNSEKRVREENLLVVSTLKILTNRKPRERIYQREFPRKKPCNGKRRKHENSIFINRKKDWKDIQTTIAWWRTLKTLSKVRKLDNWKTGLCTLLMCNRVTTFQLENCGWVETSSLNRVLCEERPKISANKEYVKKEFISCETSISLTLP